MIVENCLRICGGVGDNNGGSCRRDLCHCIFPFDVFGCLRKDPITKGGRFLQSLVIMYVQKWSMEEDGLGIRGHEVSGVWNCRRRRFPEVSISANAPR